ncbi:right-handed parallel beta-helix repeat-containing protein [Massilia sp. R2A-15]|uniref:right-handed parallel beta-helix repeat-containing protein n=1 Tax=Massilia sp. R2A-15 TaxID=3064278 RepID=UPI00273288BD|nr:right-handed parallel beta-helix repeat-containing protein [Massilia sp. R2A-15]WLI88926.1 right-handed parallel beta-helix repeat-containing protein [Massilia sp. R2A-15]
MKRTIPLLAAGALILLCAGAGAGLAMLDSAGIMPRALGPYLERRSHGHNPLIENGGRRAGQWLVALDRGAPALPQAPALAIGAQPAGAVGAGAAILVATSDEVRAAIARAEPGDTITLLPGTYRFTSHLRADRPGTAARPITVRAALPGSVSIEMATGEGFKVSAPFWRFENLALRGVCAADSDCEHAFHVVGAAHHFVASNNTIADFNAHFKINAEGRQFPDDGLIEGNTLTNSRPRRTSNPVTPVDLVTASGWTVRRNVISDFIKGDGDRVSYGGFFKGAGSGNTFEQNVVLCEHRLRAYPGQRVGLSLGGGGTGKAYCRDRRCVTEQERGVIRANLIAACSDAGIYLNSAAGSIVAHNTLVDTGGVEVRFPETSAALEGNLIDGPIRSRDGGVVRANDNRTMPVAYAYLGYHPIRDLFRAPEQFDFAWRDGVPRRAAAAAATPDLCGRERPMPPAYGAFEDFSACLTTPGARR